VITSLLLILLFVTNGLALDEENSNVAAPLMMVGEENRGIELRNKKAGASIHHGLDNSNNNADNNPDAIKSIPSNVLTVGKNNYTIDTSNDLSDSELENTRKEVNDAYEQLQRASSDKEQAQLKYKESLVKLNVLETARKISLTPSRISSPVFDAITPQEQYKIPSSFPSISGTPSGTPTHYSSSTGNNAKNFRNDFSFHSNNNNNVNDGLTVGNVAALHHHQEPPIPLPRFLSQEFNHYDPLHPVKLLPAVIADMFVSSLVVNYFFKIPFKYGIPAWLCANFIASAVASPYLTAAIEARSPNWAKSGIRNFFTSGDYWNSVFWNYYTPAWSIMGQDKKDFNVTPLEAACFMALSGLARQQADSWINKNSLYSWNQDTRSFVEKNPYAWSQENINTRALLPRWQTWRVLCDYAPDVVAALARSGSSNGYNYLLGRAAAATIIPSTERSGLIFMGGFLGYYALYRLIEYSLHPCYREKAKIDQINLQTLHSVIQNVANFGLDASLEEVNPTRTGEERPLLAATRSTGSDAPRSGVSKEILIASLDVLRSHLINWFKDPLLYRGGIIGQQPSPEVERAYRAIDLLDMYKARITDPTINSEQIKEASQQLLAALKADQTNHTDIETAPLNGIGAPNGIDALIKLFVPYSNYQCTQEEYQQFLSGQQQQQQQQHQQQLGIYGSIGSNNDDENL